MRYTLAVSLILLIRIFSFSQSFTVFLLGDAGKPTLPDDPNLSFLKTQLDNASADDVFLILGDNIYPNGLPSKEDPDRPLMEARLNAQLDLIKGFKGRSFIVPGNHDWRSARSDGYQGVLEEERYVREYLGRDDVFLPGGGCPGPVEISLSPEVTLIIIDTQYLLHPWEKPGSESSCENKSTFEALLELEELVKKNANKHLLVAGHHPMYTHGPHGGHYTLRQHLFPLSDLNRRLLIPLPGLGSIYPLYRQILASREDIRHPRYRLIRKNMTRSFETVPDLMYLSGHEHSLQYILHGGNHYVISGSGSKSSPVKAGKDTKFQHEGIGFAAISFPEHEPVKLRFWNGQEQKLIHETDLYQKKVIQSSTLLTDFDFMDSTVTVPVSTQYLNEGKIHKSLLGENYREVWATPVEVPVFNIGHEHGGLKIIKLGGGNQTKSLRLEDKDGRQYVLRSLEKYTDKLVPPPLRRTLAADILQDEISGANPFGAFAIPPMADAIGIYHTNPKMVFIPDDPRFGEYRETFAGLVVIYEERPNDEFASEEYFGGGKEIISTIDLLFELYKDNDNQVDQPFTLRSRLFDNIIADWDRHDDQWRWVRFGEGKGNRYRPIPRDRDQAFFVSEGLIPWLASRKFALPNTEGFHETIDYPAGFNTSGRFFDRTFLNELDWSDWEKEIMEIRKSLSDEVISRALEAWPQSIRELEAERTIEILKKRRDNLLTSAREHYLFLSKEVEIIGSDKWEYFLVERLNDYQTRVTVWKVNKKGDREQVIYQRTFLTSETDEIRLYGLDGEDEFLLTGNVKVGIRVRIIGGTDKDKITDESTVRGSFHKTLVYDRKKSTEVSGSSETKARLSNNPDINAYNRTAFRYNKLFPLVSIEFNPDDGLFLGGGFLFTKHGWRQEPFAQQHSFKANLALETWAVNAYYKGTFNDVVGKWDWINEATLRRPFGVNNYFGMGNESEFLYRKRDLPMEDDPIDYYRIRFEQITLFSGLSRKLGNRGQFTIGPKYFGYELEENRDRFISSPASDQDQSAIYRQFSYGGVYAELKGDTRNHLQLPERGVYAQLSAGEYFRLNSTSRGFSQVSGEFSFFMTAHLPMAVTVGNKIGASKSMGGYEFFNGATLGRENVRGYRRTRFIGDESLYHNLDIRIKLAGFRTYLFPGSLGIVGFHDIGRVWLDGESSEKWHKSYGAGFWISPLNQWVFVLNWCFTDEENLPTATVGFQF